jgi:pimeloyl-ACP methyl ester carboxylesterase
MTDTTITPFQTPVDDDALADLRRRLEAVRWPTAETVDDWSQGTPLAFLQRVCAHWRDEYDWHDRAALLDGHSQFTTTIDDLRIHFVHVRSPEPNALPLVLTHGWPGSIVEFQDVIGPLADPAAHGGDPADAFHVICPSLPGYGWSDPPATTGYGVMRIAAMWAALMDRLGYERYGAQGGDWGAMVTTALGGVDADHVVGIHLNMPLAFPIDAPIDAVEEAIVADFATFLQSGSGYQQLQSTRPQSVGYGLVDSPAGLAGWVLEKFHAWSDHDGNLTDLIEIDRLLDNLMLYWLPGSGASSARLYWETGQGMDLPQVAVPVGCTIFPKEMIRTSRRWAEAQFPDLRSFTTAAKGGHFAALEQPERFVDEVRSYFRQLR